MKMFFERHCLVFFIILGYCISGTAEVKNVLILFEGSDISTNYARGDARELAMLLGHFAVTYKIQGVDSYKSNEIENYDLTFYIGFSKKNLPPDRFLKEIYTTQKNIVWINTGFEFFSAKFDLRKKFGFIVTQLDTVSNFDVVTAANRNFTKGEPNLNIINIADNRIVEIIATAFSTSKRKEDPYIVRSGNLIYIADSPFASATETDRYIYFADLLHDLLGQLHEEKHSALLRIEDVDVFENPSKLRDIADMLYSKDVPFLVGVIPLFVDPSVGMRVSLSDKPEFVDALHYMVSRGATIVMHGVTHQYQGTTATDFEFWDGSLNRKLKNDSKEYVEKKMKMGLEEFWKNNLYPLIWETPHYTASQLDYPIFAQFFSTAMEQRCVIDDADYSQYFPYIIDHDLYGQRILPENLGYIPLDPDPKVEIEAIQNLLNGAKSQLAVRDGFASAFIHAFIDIEYIERYVDGIVDLGYTFMNVKDLSHWVHTKDHVVFTGSQSFEITLEDQFLRKTWLQPDGDIDKRDISTERIRGVIKDKIELPVREIFVAEPVEFRETELTWLEKFKMNTTTFIENVFKSDEIEDEARVALLWDQKAKGGAYNDQASFAAAFRSVNIDVDTLVEDSIVSLNGFNLLIVPYHTVERLSDRDYGKIVQFIEDGGNLITDGKNSLSEELGVKFASSKLKIERMRDRLFPEDALIPKIPEIMTRFDKERNDDLLCTEEKTDIPVVLGRKYGNGKFIFIGIRFDPVSTGGFSRFPYLLQYVGSFFHLKPILRRENLEVYFDDGYRHNVSIEDLVKHWVANGVRVIHVVGWHQYQTWSYDYDRLIKLCHSNGILVYAWLDPPQVSEKFWKDHPEWQELNYKGEAVKPSWRFPVALTDSACFEAVKKTFKDFILKYDWDGVNIAELYFEAGNNGPEDAKLMTPMHGSVRTDFKRETGFDPVLLFDHTSQYYWKINLIAWKQFETYRTETLTRLHEEFLKLMDEIRHSKPYFEVVITAMDNLGNPELRTNNGVDILKIIELRKKYKFTLQIEDPQTEWSKDPRRYIQLGQRYGKILDGWNKNMIDINILQFRDEKKPTQFPTLIQTGIESYQLVYSAAVAAGRVGIYSESSIRPQDFQMMSYSTSALANVQHIHGGWKVITPFPVLLKLPRQYSSLIHSSGERITSDRGMYFLPPGEHTLRAEQHTEGPFNATPPTTGRLLSLSGELISLANSNRSVSFNYRSDTRCYATFSHRPYTIFVDEKEIDIPILEGYHRYSIVLPHGEHTILVILETTVSYGVDITSFWSSWLIVGFGMLSGAALLTFYTLVRISRSSGESI